MDQLYGDKFLEITVPIGWLRIATTKRRTHSRSTAAGALGSGICSQRTVTNRLWGGSFQEHFSTKTRYPALLQNLSLKAAKNIVGARQAWVSKERFSFMFAIYPESITGAMNVVHLRTYCLKRQLFVMIVTCWRCWSPKYRYLLFVGLCRCCPLCFNKQGVSFARCGLTPAKWSLRMCKRRLRKRKWQARYWSIDLSNLRRPAERNILKVLSTLIRELKPKKETVEI